MYSKKIFKRLGFESQDDLINFLNRGEVKTFIGKNYNHYRELWIYHYQKKVEGKNPKKVRGRINWLGFLLPISWFAYRKMYTFTFSILIVILLINIAESYFNKSFHLSAAITVMALFAGKYYYLLHIKGKIDKIDEMTLQNKATYINKYSGTNTWLAWLIIPIAFLVSFIGDVIGYSFTESAKYYTYFEYFSMKS